MTNNISIFQFACEMFGYDNAVKLNNDYIENFYNDWKSTPYTVDQYKALLRTKG